MPKTTEEIINTILERREQWERLYPRNYILKHFQLQDHELEAVIDTLKKIKENGR